VLDRQLRELVDPLLDRSLIRRSASGMPAGHGRSNAAQWWIARTTNLYSRYGRSTSSNWPEIEARRTNPVDEYATTTRTAP
jgi:hypothetical protein